MANLSEVKPGSKLRIEVEVLEVDDSDVPAHVIFAGRDDWIVREWVEAAEHIPATKAFKRRDVVKTSDVIGGDRRNGGIVLAEVPSMEGYYYVSWPRHYATAPQIWTGKVLELDE